MRSGNSGADLEFYEFKWLNEMMRCLASGSWSILALTAAALEENMRSTREAGCDAHVTKPIKKNTLLTAIRNAVTGEGAAAAINPGNP